MSNRLPVLDMLAEYFPDYQIFLTTYDKAWYEIAKQRTSNGQWEYAEFYSEKTDEYEIPIHVQDKPYLEKAKAYFAANDHKASAIYLRTAFEAAIKKFCETKNLRVKYRENPKELTSEDFWTPIKTGTLKRWYTLIRKETHWRNRTVPKYYSEPAQPFWYGYCGQKGNLRCDKSGGNT